MAKISKLNDDFRRTGLGGKTFMTQGVSAFPSREIAIITHAVMNFDDFTPDNDPHKEHDFGSFDHNGEKIYWKIDYYDRNFEYGSEDPSDPSKTGRVLTILLASEY